MNAERPPQDAGLFRWPPGPIEVVPQQHTAGAAVAMTPSRGIPLNSGRSSRPGFWSSVERTWLGLSVPPLVDRAADAEWAIDPLDRFCWRCGLSVGPFDSGANGCSQCPPKRPAWSRYVRLGPYTSVLREAIHELKFEAWRAMGRTLGHELGRQIARALDADGAANGPASRAARTGITLVPVPTTFRRRMLRGVDHSLVLARAAAEPLGARVLTLLARRHRPSQLDVPPSEREANARGSMRLTRRRDLAPGLVIVIDDVMTTGATLRAACRPLEAAAKPTRSKLGPDALVLWTATLARTEPSRRSGAVNPDADEAYGFSHAPGRSDA